MFWPMYAVLRLVWRWTYTTVSPLPGAVSALSTTAISNTSVAPCIGRFGDRLPDPIYQHIHGLTDSEHIFAMVLQQLEVQSCTLSEALHQVLHQLTLYAADYGVRIAANIILSDGIQLVASRYDTTGKAPSLYWLIDHPYFPDAVVLASEPLFEAAWVRCPEHTLITVDADRDLHLQSLTFAKAGEAA
jgi:predicted glutamine amidotransferase